MMDDEDDLALSLDDFEEDGGDPLGDMGLGDGGDDAPSLDSLMEDNNADSSMADVLGGGGMVPSGRNGGLEAAYDIPVQVTAVLGKTTMQVSQLLKLGRGAVVELDRKVGDPIDIYVNNRLVARGEVVVVNDKLGVTMTDIIKSDHN